MALFAEAQVSLAYLFGSRATGVHRADSDADVAVRFREPIGLLAESALADRLAGVLDVPAVDLVDLDRAPLRLRGRVLQEGVLLFSDDEPARVAFEVRTRGQWFDFRPMLDEHRDRFLARVAAGGLDGRP